MSAFVIFLNVSIFAAEKDIRVENRKDGFSLAGTLAMPDNIDNPHIAILLVSGSGPQNRDEEILGKRPFKVLSDSLVNSGYIVLRMDDRGVGESGGEYSTAVTDDFVDDAEAGIDYLRTVYPYAKIGVLGHSLGGTIAIKLAKQHKADFIITLAAPAWPGDSLIMEQCRISALAVGGKWDGEAVEREILSIAKSNLSDLAAYNMVYYVMAQQLGTDMVSLPVVQKQLDAAASSMMSPFYRDMLRYDPAEDISQVQVPWIALNGEKDTQVPILSLETIRALNPGVMTIPVPGHNHLFQKVVTGSVSEYATSGVSPSAETIAIIKDALKKLLSM